MYVTDHVFFELHACRQHFHR